MSLTNIAKQVEKYVIDNSPSIMTGLGVVGTIATAYLTGKAGYKTAQILSSQDPHESLMEKTKRVWPEYIPPVIMGSISVVAIIGANKVGSRRAAAVAAAYSLTEKAFAEYKEKVVDKIGEKKNQKIYDEIAQEKVEKNPPSTREIIITGNGDVMCYDTLTGRYFMSSMEQIKSVVNEINRRIITYDYASLTEFYDLLGLSATVFSEEVGWKFENMIDISFSTVLSDDGKPCLAIQYNTPPGRNYYRVQ